MAFCLEAEEFVDDKLSNWYVRRNRRRFWKSEQGRRQAGRVSDAVHGADDADEAVRPGHAVPDGDDVSEPGASTRSPGERASCAIIRTSMRHLIDEPLSADMDALLRLVSLGSAARNA